MRQVSFTVPGRIGGKQRHKTFVHRGVTIHKTPEQTVIQEGVIKHFAHMAMVKDRLPLLRGPLRLTVLAWRNYPKSWSAKKCGLHTYVTGKPDYDNICKVIGDALNGIAYLDDSQFASAVFDRFYRMDSNEEVHITIAELEVQS